MKSRMARVNMNKMNIQVPDLENEHEYKLLQALRHEELIPFVQQNLKKLNQVTVFYFAVNILILIFTTFRIYTDLTKKPISWDTIISGLGIGFFITFFIGFFIHENIHLLAYKILGAKQATIKVQWRKMIFLALADQFVLKRKAFYFLALLPFVVITSILITCLFFTSGYYTYAILGILILHTGGCSGDFSLVSYFYSNSAGEIVTYDDVAENKSYFYEVILNNKT